MPTRPPQIVLPQRPASTRGKGNRRRSTALPVTRRRRAAASNPIRLTSAISAAPGFWSRHRRTSLPVHVQAVPVSPTDCWLRDRRPDRPADQQGLVRQAVAGDWVRRCARAVAPARPPQARPASSPLSPSSEPHVASRPPPVALPPVALRPVALRPVALRPVALQPVALQPVALQPVSLRPFARHGPFFLPPVARQQASSQPPIVAWLSVQPLSVPQPFAQRQRVVPQLCVHPPVFHRHYDHRSPSIQPTRHRPSETVSRHPSRQSLLFHALP